MYSVSEIDTFASQASLEEWYQSYLRAAVNGDDGVFAFPESDIQKITNNQTGETTARNAISIFETVVKSFSSIREVTRDCKVLDYGCGWGRITRLLPYYFDSENVYGVDVDERLVTAAMDGMAGISISQSTCMESLDFEDGTFDLILANSVFSHLSEEAHRYTISEISRCLNVGGVAVLSVLGRGNMRAYYGGALSSWIERILGPIEDAERALDETGCVWGDTNRWDHYGIAIVDDDWLRATWACHGLEVKSCDVRESAGSQLYFTAVKRAN